MKNPKVGERVVMYLADKRVTGFIKEFYNDKTPTVLFIEDGNFYEWMAHPKQLRRLVPKKRTKKRMEFWIVSTRCDAWHVYGSYSDAYESLAPGEEIIHVREVKP